MLRKDINEDLINDIESSPEKGRNQYQDETDDEEAK